MTNCWFRQIHSLVKWGLYSVYSQQQCGRSLPKSCPVGIHIWFVASQSGGSIRIKQIERNPLRGNVDTDAPESAAHSVL